MPIKLAPGGGRDLYRHSTTGQGCVNWVDAVIILLLVCSALLALLRGFVREVLGIAAWIGAGFFAAWAFPFVKDRFHEWIKTPDMADAAAFGALYIAALILLSVVASIIGRLVRSAGLGGVDSTLGVVFGLLRGAALVVAAYILVGWAVPDVDHWPAPMREARLLPFAYEGAVWSVGFLPVEYRPGVRKPPVDHALRSEELMHPLPQGRATTPP